jgi:hypothetical protein
MDVQHRVLARYVQALRRTASKEIPRKGKKYDGSFHGDDNRWWLGGYLEHSDWDAAMSLSSKNDWKNLSVEGATEHHAGFRHALNKMVEEYPELLDFIVSFDGPYMPVSKLVHVPVEHQPNWSALTFYHGTSSWAAERILKEGLRPRSATNVNPAYGVSSSASSGRADAIYLTTQLQMAHFAAIDAAKTQKASPVVLEVRGIDERYVAADEDSKTTDAAQSLAKLGSIAYLAPITSSKIRLSQRMEDREWINL